MYLLANRKMQRRFNNAVHLLPGKTSCGWFIGILTEVVIILVTYNGNNIKVFDL